MMFVMWWAGFILFVILFLALDLGLEKTRFKKQSAQTALAALGWSLFWIVLACLFTGILALWYPVDSNSDRNPALEFFTGYLVEKSLSLDNLFVIASIFLSLQIPPAGQKRALAWGIMGAIVMRFIMILIGTALFSYFHWTPLIFGAILIYTAFRMAFAQTSTQSLEATQQANNDNKKNFVLRVVERWIPFTTKQHDQQFFVYEDGVRKATPLFLALLQVEACDLLFAVDSIPAIFAITKDPFIVMSSNVFAIFGLRALYLLISKGLQLFRYLHATLSILLGFVGFKMLMSLIYPIPLPLSFAIMATILITGILASYVHTLRNQ